MKCQNVGGGEVKCMEVVHRVNEECAEDDDCSLSLCNSAGILFSSPPFFSFLSFLFLLFFFLSRFFSFFVNNYFRTLWKSSQARQYPMHRKFFFRLHHWCLQKGNPLSFSHPIIIPLSLLYTNFMTNVTLIVFFLKY